jgi:hypothetical protein
MDSCFPSPRSWTYAAKDLSNATLQGLDDDFKITLIAGRVGKEAAEKFKIWIKYLKDLMPAIDNIILQKKYPIAGLGMTEEKTLICAVYSVKRIFKHLPSADEEQRYKIFTNVFDWLITIPSSFAVAALKTSLSQVYVEDFSLMENESFLKLFKNIEKDMRGYYDPDGS